MADTYVYLIHEPDWDSDFAATPEAHNDPDFAAAMAEHGAFAQAVEQLGARMVGGHALTNAKYGGSVVPGAKERKTEDAVFTDGPFADTSEVITGFYIVETDNEEQARTLATLVPTGGRIEWRKVIPMG